MTFTTSPARTRLLNRLRLTTVSAPVNPLHGTKMVTGVVVPRLL